MLLAALTLGPVLAGPVDLVGFGAPAMGRAGGGVALTDGAQTAFRNPATLQDMELAELSIGASLFRMEFSPLPDVWWDTNRDGVIDDQDAPLSLGQPGEPADAVWVALGRPVGRRFGLALNASLPVRRLLRIQTFEPSLPEYFMLENRAQRIDLALGFGWALLDGLSVGGGVEAIARARYSLTTTLDVTLRGAQEGDEDLGSLVTDLSLDPHTMTLDIVPGFAPMASVYLDLGRLSPLLDGLTLGGVFRGSTGLPVDVTVDIQADINAEDLGEAADLGTTILVPIHLAVYDHYVPARWSLGLAWTRPDVLRFYVDAHHTRWSGMPVSVAHVVDTQVQSQLLTLPDPSVADGNQLDVTLDDTWSVRAGGEVTLPPLQLGGRLGAAWPTLRAGWGYEPTPLVSQPSTTALLDARRLILAGGAGVRHDAPFALVEGPVRWDLFGQIQVLGQGALPVDATPYRAGAPVDGGTIPVGGLLWTAGIQWCIDHL